MFRLDPFDYDPDGIEEGIDEFTEFGLVFRTPINLRAIPHLDLSAQWWNGEEWEAYDDATFYLEGDDRQALRALFFQQSIGRSAIYRFMARDRTE